MDCPQLERSPFANRPRPDPLPAAHCPALLEQCLQSNNCLSVMSLLATKQLSMGSQQLERSPFGSTPLLNTLPAARCLALLEQCLQSKACLSVMNLLALRTYWQHEH